MSIKLWTWLAKTGKCKGHYPDFEVIQEYKHFCPLCEVYYSEEKSRSTRCGKCPLVKYRKKDICDFRFYLWGSAFSREERKIHARKVLEHLLEAKREEENEKDTI